MSAQPVPEHDPDDPVEILGVQPGQFHDQFLTEYRAAAQAACQPEGFRTLQELLRLWRLRAVAYCDPGYLEAVAEARAAARAGRSRKGSVPIEDIIADWPEWLALGSEQNLRDDPDDPGRKMLRQIPGALQPSAPRAAETGDEGVMVAALVRVVGPDEFPAAARSLTCRVRGCHRGCRRW